MGKKKVVGALIAIAVILATTFITMDWALFYRCGAVEQCIVEGSRFQNIAKFVVTAIMTIVVFCIGENAHSPRDRKLLQAAFAMALCADFCMKIIHDASLFGICFFMVVQALFIFRHTRKSDTDKHIPRFFIIPMATMILMGAFSAFGVFKSPTIPIALTYASFLGSSLTAACRVAKTGYYPTPSAKQIKWGLDLFFCCDICVGLSSAAGDDYSTRETIATIAHNFVWIFYTPSLILLGLSGYKNK